MVTATPETVNGDLSRSVTSREQAKRHRKFVIIGFLVIPLSLMTLFSVYPFLQLIYFSMTDWDGLSPDSNFVGLDNYHSLLVEGRGLLLPMVNSLYYFAGSLMQLALATYFAVILNRGMPGSSMYRLVLFLPFVLNSVAVSIIFRDFLQIGGGIDAVFEVLGLGAFKQQWVQDPDLVKWSLVFASVWRYMGFQLLITYGALQAVPTDQYEAARIEGASEWQQFWYITFPSIKMILGLQIILSTVGSLEVFEVPFLITGGANGTKTFIMAAIEEAFNFRRLGMASAMSMVLIMIVIVVITIQRLFMNRGKNDA
ncbi:sugar ABC transporter permease [Rhodophyticola sp. CCM32]|uniref:carbohydrate ABC transporter permease n=1 Tax=Rhodophyticola sp. CCM32 TaxID=2916397 RepID=UPI00107FBC22|nr:sugar ABC transporter permease [Rhodophyticola sp. CCM32]QBY01225.1 sugar ABC transporter permease [Rhodophyticola sp. CCM32]